MIGGSTQRAKIPANLVGPQIRRLRVALGWSQARLALRLQLGGLDLGRETIAQIEAQTHCVKDRDLHHFSRALGVGLSDLFPRVQTPSVMPQP